MASKPTRKEVLTFASRELQREQSNVVAFVDRHREIEELPEGLETGFVKNRKPEEAMRAYARLIETKPD